MSEIALTAERLRELLDYNPESGIFTWVARRRGCRPGDAVGTSHEGHISIGLNHNRYYAHRLAWLYVTGKWPPAQVDHKNLDRSDNRWTNLRLASNQQNQANQNAQKNNLLGIKGVSRVGSKYKSQITHKKRNYYLGMFQTPEEAIAAYKAAAETLFGEFARAT
jgi:phosphotransferase system IIB component